MDLLEQLACMDETPLVAPWAYTEDVFPVAELDRSLDRWYHTPVSERPKGGYQGWKRGYSCAGPSGHTYFETTAHRPDREARLGTRTVRRAHCECGWVSSIGDDRETVAWWHDHAWPGWRDLEVLADPHRSLDAKPGSPWAKACIDAYGRDWCESHGPVITFREGYGTRNVPGGSPWGGFDMCHLSLDVPA